MPQDKQVQQQAFHLDRRTEDEFKERAREGALKVYDDAIKDKKAPAKASKAARKTYDKILKPWGLE